ncbi:MAG: CpsD/CapB family tyrosine-protein kinase [Planctomycetota bacterium]
MSHEPTGVISPKIAEMPDVAPGHERAVRNGLAGRRRAAASKSQRRRGSEYYDTILWRARPQSAASDRAFTLAVTGCDRRSGVSTVAANLAIRAADHHQSPVLIIDGNLENPSVARTFRLDHAPGFTELLSGECTLGEAIHASSVEGLSVLPLGDRGLVDRTRVDAGYVGNLFEELGGEFATIVVDLPPVDQLRHGLLLAKQSDAALLVVRSEATRARAARAATEQLTGDGVNVAGAVVTARKNYLPRWFRRWL